MTRHDENIINDLFERKESALTLIEEKYGRLICSAAYNLFRSDSVAEECLNDTLLAIWNTIPPERPDSLASYAVAISRRRAIDRVRRDTAGKRHEEYPAYYEVRDELAFSDDVAEGVVDRMELTRIMNEFLGSLGGRNREIFMRRFFDFESLDSIAATMHISKNGVKSRLSKMKADLSERLKEGTK